MVVRRPRFARSAPFLLPTPDAIRPQARTMGKITGFALLLCFSLGACHREETVPASAPATAATLKIVGSSTMAPLVSELARAFEAKHPHVRFTIESGGSGRGVDEAR